MKAQVRGEIGSRRAARENAVELAYEQQIRGLSTADLLAERIIAPDKLTVALLQSSEDRRDEVDGLIEGSAMNWDLHRMPVMDLTVLRLAVAELLEAETPPGVVIAETVYLTGLFSTEESSKFVNGILGTIQRNLAGGLEEPSDPVDPTDAADSIDEADSAEAAEPAEPVV